MFPLIEKPIFEDIFFMKFIIKSIFTGFNKIRIQFEFSFLLLNTSFENIEIW